MEEINKLDEAKLLGYFESIRSVFLTKVILITAVTKQRDGRPYIDATALTDAINEVRATIDDPLFYKALSRGNEELYENFKDDIGTSLMLSSWNVFEQIVKDLTIADYSTQMLDLSVSYQSGRFQFDKREKKDIDLFYYIRNAICHHNGAYYAAKEIDHAYRGSVFRSNGHCGEKIDMNLKLTWEMALDIEGYTLKAWKNAKAFNPPNAKP